MFVLSRYITNNQMAAELINVSVFKYEIIFNLLHMQYLNFKFARHMHALTVFFFIISLLYSFH